MAFFEQIPIDCHDHPRHGGLNPASLQAVLVGIFPLASRMGETEAFSMSLSRCRCWRGFSPQKRMDPVSGLSQILKWGWPILPTFAHSANGQPLNFWGFHT